MACSSSCRRFCGVLILSSMLPAPPHNHHLPFRSRKGIKSISFISLSQQQYTSILRLRCQGFQSIRYSVPSDLSFLIFLISFRRLWNLRLTSSWGRLIASKNLFSFSSKSTTIDLFAVLFVIIAFVISFFLSLPQQQHTSILRLRCQPFSVRGVFSATPRKPNI